MFLPVGIAMFFLYAGQASAQVSATPVEPGAIISDDVRSEQVAALAALVSASGYRCDTGASARASVDFPTPTFWLTNATITSPGYPAAT